MTFVLLGSLSSTPAFNPRSNKRLTPRRKIWYGKCGSAERKCWRHTPRTYPGRSRSVPIRIVVWTETSAGYVATAAQVCYLGLAERSDPNNTRARSDAFQQAARALLEEAAFDVRESVDYATFVPLLIERTGCHSDTAKRHLAKAARLMRGEAAAAWGGSRPGAGRPAERRDS